jgi:hypothetical protein
MDCRIDGFTLHFHEVHQRVIEIEYDALDHWLPGSLCRACDLVFDEFADGGFNEHIVKTHFVERKSKHGCLFVGHEPFVNKEDAVGFQNAIASLEITLLITDDHAQLHSKVLKLCNQFIVLHVDCGRLFFSG